MKPETSNLNASLTTLEWSREGRIETDNLPSPSLRSIEQTGGVFALSCTLQGNFPGLTSRTRKALISSVVVQLEENFNSLEELLRSGSEETTSQEEQSGITPMPSHPPGLPTYESAPASEATSSIAVLKEEGSVAEQTSDSLDGLEGEPCYIVPSKSTRGVRFTAQQRYEAKRRDKGGYWALDDNGKLALCDKAGVPDICIDDGTWTEVSFL